MTPLDRRAFIAGTAAAASPVALVPASAGQDPVFAAIAAFRSANAAWQAALAACEAADLALAAENAAGHAQVMFPLPQARVGMRTHREISELFAEIRKLCEANGVAWNAAEMDGTAQRMRDTLDAERERIEMVRCRLNVDVLEARQESACQLARRAADAALATPPATLAGIRALAELVSDMECEGNFLNEHEDSARALATLAAACRTLLPAA